MKKGQTMTETDHKDVSLEIPPNGVDITKELEKRGSIKSYATKEECPSVAETEARRFKQCCTPEEFISRTDIDRDNIKSLGYRFSICVKEDAPDDIDTWYQSHDAVYYMLGFLQHRGAYYRDPEWLGCAVFSETGYANSNHYIWVDEDYNGVTHEISVPREQFRRNGVDSTVSIFKDLKQHLARLFTRIDVHGLYIGACNYAGEPIDLGIHRETVEELTAEERRSNEVSE